MRFFQLTVQFIQHCLAAWPLLFPLGFSGFFLYKTVAAFLPLKPGRVWRVLLFLLLSGTTGMVIWVGDNNLLFTLPVFFAVFLAVSRGNFVGRLAVTGIFFCLILTVCALLDTYYAWTAHEFGQDNFFFYSSKFLRPALAGLLYFGFRKRMPENPPRLSPKLWKLVLCLAAMPFSALLAVVLLTQNKYDSPALYATSMSLGLAVLPFVITTALALLYAVLVLTDHERLEEIEKLSELRAAYYQSLRREETQLRTLRHDLRNHLTAIRGLLALDEEQRALEYIDQLLGSAAVQGGRRLCANDTANAVLMAKAETMRREGIQAEIAASLPEVLPVEDTDLCALLGNALDNAVEAAVQAPEKWITVRCRAEKGLFMLRVENAAPQTPAPDLSTSKEDKTAHGFGIPGMREIAERYNGSLETCAMPGKFELVACLPLDGQGA